jgi:hypothetical protein
MPVRPACRQILAATNRKRNREVAKVVCRSSVASACGSRLNSISQQFSCRQTSPTGNVSRSRRNGPTDAPSTRHRCSPPGSDFRAATVVVKPEHEVDGLAEVGHQHPILVLAGFEQLVLLGFPPPSSPRALSHSAGLRTGMLCPAPPADNGIRTPRRRPS